MSNNYLPFARVLAHSFLTHHPGGRVFVCIVDRRHPKIRYDREPFDAVFVEELGIPAFHNFAFRYSILELNTAVKPFFLQYLHENIGCETLCYFDPDILITSELSELYGLLKTSDVVLTPHILKPIEDRKSPGERDFLLTGSYNLGFLGLCFNDSTQSFLSWWQERLHSECLHQVDRGLFVDQRWMDLAPAFLEGAAILRDPGYNVAYWNLVHRDLIARDEGYWVGDSRLRFFHFSGFHPDRIGAISKYQNRFDLENRPDLVALFENYRDQIVEAGYDELIGLPYSYGEFDSGLQIPLAARTALQAQDVTGDQWPNPFDTRPADSFFRWLMSSGTSSHGVWLPRIAVAVWRLRVDLQAVFPDPSKTPTSAFLRWMVSNAGRECALDDEFVEPMRRSLKALDEEQAAVRHGTATEFSNGVNFPPRVSEIIAGADPQFDRWPRPLSVEARDSLYAWLTTLEVSEPIRLPRIAVLLWRLRSDLQAVFPDVLSSNIEEYAVWLLTCGVAEELLAEPFVRPVRESLFLLRKHRIRRFLVDARWNRDQRPFDQRLSDSEIQWLLEPADQQDGAAHAACQRKPFLPRLASLVYELRSDLAQYFADPLGGSRSEFARWLVEYGRVEHGIPRRYLASTMTDLGWRVQAPIEVRVALRSLRTYFGKSSRPATKKGTPVHQPDATEYEPAADPLARLQEYLLPSGAVTLSARSIQELLAEFEQAGTPIETDTVLEFGAPGSRGVSKAMQVEVAPGLRQVFDRAWIVRIKNGDSSSGIATVDWTVDGFSALTGHRFSCVWAGRSLWQLGEVRLVSVLRELFRVTAPGGGVLFQVPRVFATEELRLEADGPLHRSVEEAGGRVAAFASPSGTVEAGLFCLALKIEQDGASTLVGVESYSGDRPLLGLLRRTGTDWNRLLDTTDSRGHSMAPVNRFLRAYWGANDYLQRVFPLNSIDDRYRFVYWLALANGRDIHIQDWLLDTDWGQYRRPVESLTEPDEESISLFQWLVWSLREDLRNSYPLSTAEGRAEFRRWMSASQDAEFSADLERIDGEIRRADSAEFGVGPPVIPSSLGTYAAGVNLIEHPESGLGLREDAELNSLALERAGVSVSRFEFFDSSTEPERARSLFRHRANLIHINADQIFPAFSRMGPQFWDGRYNIGYWLWELSAFPEPWSHAFDLLDEIWVPSRFVQETLARVSPVPVVRLPYPVRAQPDLTLRRRDFLLPERSFLFLTTFDVSSYSARKNPEATVEAFLRAFPKTDLRVGLVVKAANAGKSKAWQNLVEQARSDDRIHLFDELMVRDRLLALMNLCDSYVSLHRAEGFGRGPAEAMLLGKPAVVTGYSGNLDYTTPETACVVDHRLVRVEDGEYPFACGQVWAEPDVDDAARWMRRLVEDDELRQRISVAGRRFVRRHYSLEEAGRRFRARLNALGLL